MNYQETNQLVIVARQMRDNSWNHRDEKKQGGKKQIDSIDF